MNDNASRRYYIYRASHSGRLEKSLALITISNYLDESVIIGRAHCYRVFAAGIMENEGVSTE